MTTIFNNRTGRTGTLRFYSATHAMVTVILPSGSILHTAWPLAECEQR